MPTIERDGFRSRGRTRRLGYGPSFERLVEVVYERVCEGRFAAPRDTARGQDQVNVIGGEMDLEDSPGNPDEDPLIRSDSVGHVQESEVREGCAAWRFAVNEE